MNGHSAARTALALLLAWGCACAASDEVRARQVADAERDRVAAMVAADAPRLVGLLHESLTYTHSDGHVDTKDSLIDRLQSGEVDYRSIEIGEPAVRVLDDTALLTGRARMEILAAGRRLDLASAYTAVYRWEKGHWQLVAYQSSPAGAP